MNTKFSGTFSVSALALMLASNAFAVAKHGIDFVVGKDGDFKAAMAKAAASGASESKRFIIFFPDGEYELTKLTGDEHGKTTFSTSHVSFIGQSADKSIIWNTTDTEGISVTATLYFPKNSDIYMQDLTVQNRSTFRTSEAGRQVAIQQIGDKFIYKNVKLLSGQDTYYTKKSGGARTYWEGGQIKGTVDFICGDGDVFFEGTKLTMDRSGGYITASQNSTDWGYVFNNTTIEVSNGSYNGTFYLGRSWGHAKTVFLNTKMVAQPKAEGWGPDMNSAPVVFGEYNSKDGNGNAVNTNSRKTRFDGGKDGSTATTLKTVWNASDAAKYTLANVLGGSDNWDPTKFTKQVGAPKISQQGANIEWSDDDNAICWVVFVNGKYHSNTTSPSIDVGDISAGSKVTVRAANSMGGLGSASNEIEVLEANVDYVTVKTSAEIGGEIQMSPNREKVAEGTKVTFTAIANDGWKFAGWTGKNAADAGASDTWTTTAAADIEIGAKFTGDGSNTFQAESGTIENAIIESTNAGFKGSGYINFGTGTSTLKVPVFAEGKGKFTLTMTYANGSGSARSLSIATESGDAQELSFETTDNWTTYVTKDISVNLPAGASYITFSIVGGNDGPNLDQIKLTAVDIEKVEPVIENPDTTKTDSTGSDSTTRIAQDKLQMQTAPGKASLHEAVFTMNGKLIRQSFGTPVSTNGLKPGIYLLRSNANGLWSHKVIHQ